MTVTRRAAAASVAGALALALAWSVFGPGFAFGEGADRSFTGPPPTCRQGDILTPHRAPDDWARTLLDTELMLSATDRPPDLVPVVRAGVNGQGSIRALVIDDLRALDLAARDAGVRFRVVSAYRSYEQQTATFASVEQADGLAEALRSVARPGHSEHQLGTAIDVEGATGWLADNAWRYGFVVSYPPDRSPEHTCYMPEPWHLRYLGRATAREIHTGGLSPREWLWARQAGD